MTTFREECIQAHRATYAQEEANNAEYRREGGIETRAAFVNLFQREPDSVDFMTVRLGDVTIARRADGRYNDWRIIGKCPKCGALCDSDDVHSLADIGAHLLDFKPHYSHVCEVNQPQAVTIESRLADIIREIVRQEVAA